VCLLLLVLAFKMHRQRACEISLLALAAVTAWIGFQVSLFALCACTAAWWPLRLIKLREVFMVALGVALGALLLVLFLSWKDVLAYFLPMVLGMMGKRYAHAPGFSPSAAFHKMFYASWTS